VQADNDTSRKFGGTGLGLAISKYIVEMMGGKIWIKSDPGKGSTFSFTLQARRVSGDSVAAEKPLEKNSGLPSPDGAFKGQHILLAEDIDINREIVLTLLEPMEAEIDCAVNGAEALRMFSENPRRYAIIFMDLQMPEMDGFEATRRIRSLPAQQAKDIPIIAMTANVFKEDIEECLEAGMNDHVGKPLDIEEMMEKLRKYLPRRP
jgi:CheY-like chemotaxis protein